MNKQTKEKLYKILEDKSSGSSEILVKLNEFFKHLNSSNDLEESIRLANKYLNHFSEIENYIKNLYPLLKRRDKDGLENYYDEYIAEERLKYRYIFERVYAKCKSINRIITLSRSRTLLNIFKMWKSKNKKLSIVVCESRPAMEGRLFAKDLLKTGLKIEVITDAMMNLFIPHIDAAFVGADSILKSGNIVNKTGSAALALLSQKYKKPFYVVSTKSKISNRKRFKQVEENSSQVWDYKENNLNVINYPFEEINKKFITKIFTD